MERIAYYGSLEDDIDDIKSEGKKWDLILARVIAQGIITGIDALVLIGLGKITNTEVNWVLSLTTITILNTITTVRGFFKDIDERKLKASSAKADIKGLANDINSVNENEDANNLVPVVLPENIKEAVITKEEKKYKDRISSEFVDKDYTKKTKITNTDFFLLDTADKLRILREVRIEVKEHGRTDVDKNLYLLEDDEIPSYVPVVRKLERK